MGVVLIVRDLGNGKCTRIKDRDNVRSRRCTHCKCTKRKGEMNKGERERDKEILSLSSLVPHFDRFSLCTFPVLLSPDSLYVTCMSLV